MMRLKRNAGPWRQGIRRALLMAGLLLPAVAAAAQTFTVDFSRWADPPLVKTKFGVYQTPLLSRERPMASLPLRGEIGARDLRCRAGRHPVSARHGHWKAVSGGFAR
ncbi:MAG: hypothetical protein JO250_19900 [Armatimonadetes bacterium]|nr:hypothetical protein [Armatimonadota bacterium]